MQTLFKRRAALLRKEEYKGVPGLAKALEALEEGKFKKAVALVYSPAAQKVRTNNHAERANRRFRFAEKSRYKWRRRKWVLRFLLLAVDRWWRQVAGTQTHAGQAATAEQRPRTSSSKGVRGRWG